MSESLRSRDRVENVRKQKGIPEQAHGGEKVEIRPARPPQPKEKPSLLRMPDMSQISPYEQIDREIMFTREVLCAMVRQAVLDAKNDKEYETLQNQNERELNQRSAIEFLKSDFCADLLRVLGDCSGIGLPADKIRLEAMK